MNLAYPITPELLTSAVPGLPASAAARLVQPLRAAFAFAEITTAARAAMFLAQAGHESGSFQWFEENLNYSAEGLRRVFPRYFNAKNAVLYARKPAAIANKVYANRMGNGPEGSGDGWRFRGTGPIQATGREKFQMASSLFGLDLVEHPEWAREDITIGMMMAAMFWAQARLVPLNALADRGRVTEASKTVNGGWNGLEDRRARYTRAVRALPQLEPITVDWRSAIEEAKRRYLPDTVIPPPNPTPPIQTRVSVTELYLNGVKLNVLRASLVGHKLYVNTLDTKEAK